MIRNNYENFQNAFSGATSCYMQSANICIKNENCVINDNVETFSLSYDKAFFFVEDGRTRSRPCMFPATLRQLGLNRIRITNILATKRVTSLCQTKGETVIPTLKTHDTSYH